MSKIVNIFFALIVLVISGCDFIPEKVSPSDPRIAAMLHAIDEVDRKALGFTPISSDSEIRLEKRPRAGYDTMLHLHSTTSRTIAFLKTDTGYKWVHEQEVHTGPRTYESVDGVFHEEIVITYELISISGRTPSKLDVKYHGEDPRLANHHELTLEMVKSILEEWKGKRKMTQ